MMRFFDNLPLPSAMITLTPQEQQALSALSPYADIANACAQALALAPAVAASQCAPADPGRGAHWQFNGLFAKAKQERVPPRSLTEPAAALLAPLLPDHTVSPSGAGFVNFTLSDAAIAARAQALSALPGFGLPTLEASLCVIDHSSPNISKRMHAGHLRSTVIGDALARMLGRLGKKVERQNHIGDFGTPFGMLVAQAQSEALDTGSLDIDGLDALYQRASARYKASEGPGATEADKAFAQSARERTRDLQNQEPTACAIWRELRSISLAHAQDLYGALGVGLNASHIRGESFYEPLIASTMTELIAKGAAQEQPSGAIVSEPPGLAPLMLRKSHAVGSGWLYGATDAAALRHRALSLGARDIIYVVDARQTDHFKTLFEMGKQAGWLAEGSRPIHCAFGMILDANGEPLKSRSGDTLPLMELIEAARAQCASAFHLNSPDTHALRDELACGALRYGDLSRDRESNATLNLKHMAAMRGNTAPYLAYTFMRLSSLMAKAAQAGILPGPILGNGLGAPERELALHALDFAHAYAQAATQLRPHLLCDWAFGHAQRVSALWDRSSVLFEPDAQRQASRLSLLALSRSLLQVALVDLGIPTPTSMPVMEQAPDAPKRKRGKPDTAEAPAALAPPRQGTRGP